MRIEHLEERSYDPIRMRSSLRTRLSGVASAQRTSTGRSRDLVRMRSAAGGCPSDFSFLLHVQTFSSDQFFFSLFLLSFSVRDLQCIRRVSFCFGCRKMKV